MEAAHCKPLCLSLSVFYKCSLCLCWGELVLVQQVHSATQHLVPQQGGKEGNIWDSKVRATVYYTTQVERMCSFPVGSRWDRTQHHLLCACLCFHVLAYTNRVLRLQNMMDHHRAFGASHLSFLALIYTLMSFQGACILCVFCHASYQYWCTVKGQ